MRMRELSEASLNSGCACIAHPRSEIVDEMSAGQGSPEHHAMLFAIIRHMSPSSTPLLQLLREQLSTARMYNAEVIARNRQGKIVDVPGIGKKIAGVYEHLRRAAESVEDQLLLQRAIRRFYSRSIAFSSGKRPNGVGTELVIDMTHAGYIANETVSEDTCRTIARLVEQYVAIYQNLGHLRVPRDVRLGWVLDILSVETEVLLNPHHERSALAYVAFRHYLELFPRDKIISTPEEDTQYEFSLYIAVHQALLRSDIATVRHDLIRVYRQSPDDLPGFAKLNHSVDEIFASPLTQRLRLLLGRYGAPFRVIRALTEDRQDMPELLGSREVFLNIYYKQIGKEYDNLSKRLNRGILRSILFIFITKIWVGLAIEVPYDLLMLGHIAALPLAVNLLFPPLYMASFKFGLKIPGSVNAAALRNYIDQAFYTGGDLAGQYLRLGKKSISPFARVVYTLLLLIPFSVMLYVLSLLEFAVTQGIIFFVFLSTASFLGFRLSRMPRDFELVPRHTKFSNAVRDFFYLPFIVMGQWISSRYARINLVARALDILVEMPLKTMLRRLRQWVRFLNEKHEEIL